MTCQENWQIGEKKKLYKFKGKAFQCGKKYGNLVISFSRGPKWQYWEFSKLLQMLIYSYKRGNESK